MVSTIVSAQAHIAVENIELKYKNSQDTIYELPLSLESVANKVVNIKDYLDVAVFPEKANNYTIEWKISGNVTYTDEEYYKSIKTISTIPNRAKKSPLRRHSWTKTATKRRPTRRARWL